MNPKERRRVCPKIKLHELKNYLNVALNEAKADFLKKSKMNEEQFNLFLKINEQKIKETIPEESENLDSNLSTNYMNSFTDEETSLKKLTCFLRYFKNDKYSLLKIVRIQTR